MRGGAAPAAAALLLALRGSAAAAAGAVPTARLNNGVEMPRVAAAPSGKGSAAAASVKAILSAGLTHIFTAEDYFNQAGVKDGLAAYARDAYFLTSMTTPCIHSASKPKRNVSDPAACYNLTVSEFLAQNDALGVEAVDLMMLHGPSEPYGFQGACEAGLCEVNRAQWRAYVDMYHAGKARAVGVSNYCKSCLECILTDPALPAGDQAVVPAVNQLQMHVGMGADPHGLMTYLSERGIALQAYSPLAGGALATDAGAAAAGAAHNKSAAQAALRWVAQLPLSPPASFVTSAASPQYLPADADVFGWSLSDAEVAPLSARSCETDPQLCKEHAGTSSWGCTV